MHVEASPDPLHAHFVEDRADWAMICPVNVAGALGSVRISPSLVL